MTLKTLFPAFLLLLSYYVQAQSPVANFTVSQINGCNPLTVSFRDSSSGSPKFWNWDFGNGQISNVQHPTITYTRPGTYSVTLVVRNSDGTNGITKENLITVSSSPVASFSVDRLNACLPSTLHFTDKSSDSTGNIASWEWNFGDGTTSNEQNPSHSYTEPGFYNVSLKVTSSTGCTSAVTRARLIRIFAGVVADFVPIPPSTCNAPFRITLNNQSSGPGVLTYSWDLGSGGTSNTLNPTVTYNSSGTYTAKLTTTSDFGCSNTVEKSFPVQQFNTSFDGPDTICINSTASFTNTSTDIANDMRWRIRDSSYKGNTVTRTFKTAGTFPVKLIQDFENCTDSVVKNLTVMPKPAIQFNSNIQEGCRIPLSVRFNDVTPDAVAWTWDFGDNSSSAEKAPEHIYTSFGKFTVKLIVTDRFGCTDTLTKTDYIQVAAPVATITNAPSGGCEPFTYRPVLNVVSNDPVSTYAWDFGDGGSAIQANPVHVYSDSGTYDLSLRITTVAGCEDTVLVRNGIRVGKKPVVNFSTETLDACASMGISFTDLSTGGVNGWNWNFGDGETSNLKNPTHVYKDTGMITVTLTASNNGCPASVTKKDLLHIKPPVAAFKTQVNCQNLGDVNFINSSLVDPLQKVTYLWNFGDPANSIDSVKNPVFSYPGTGTYSVILTVTQDTCSSADTLMLELNNETADFVADKTSACLNEAVQLSATGSDANNIRSYQWKIGNGRIFTGNRSFTTRINTPGIHDIMLIITDLNGCTDTLVRPGYLSISGPSASYTISSKENCTNAAVEFMDGSRSDVAISSWAFDFGDGNTQTFTNAPFTHVYADTGFYKVVMTVTDINGCSSSYSRDSIVHLSSVKAAFDSDSTLLCPGLPFSFTNLSEGNNLQYYWDFGDGTSSTEFQPVHAFTGNDSSYTVSLKVTNAEGCSDSISKQDFISIKIPKPAFTVGDTLTMCPPFETIFFNTGTDYETIYWDMGDGTNILLGDTVRHFYNNYGTFTAQQIMVGFGGCRDTATQTIRVVNPSSVKFDYSPLTACNRLTVDFSLEPPPGTRFTFAFGDGKTDTTQNTSLSHFYGSPAIYNPVMIITDPIGCVVNVGGKQPIRIIGAIPLFGVDNKEFCDSGTVYFTNYTIGNDPVISYRWDFGDGQSSTVPDEVHTYSGPGRYIASLTVNTQSGCQDVITDTISIYGTPVTNIMSKDTVCVGELVHFAGQLADPSIAMVNYDWNFGDGQGANINNPVNRFMTAGVYTVTLNTQVPFGCSSVSTKQVVVVENPSITFGAEPVTISGRSVPIEVSYIGDIIKYEWTPPNSLTCFDCPFPSAKPQYDTRYNLTVTDVRGCTDTSSVLVKVVCTGSNTWLPTTFSPNGDGSNDIFYVRGTSIFSVKSFRIFNRWGQMVFERMNFDPNQQTQGWNGTLNGKPLPSDVYVYALEIVCKNGEVFQDKGNVMLLR